MLNAAKIVAGLRELKLLYCLTLLGLYLGSSCATGFYDTPEVCHFINSQNLREILWSHHRYNSHKSLGPLIIPYNFLCEINLKWAPISEELTNVPSVIWWNNSDRVLHITVYYESLWVAQKWPNWFLTVTMDPETQCLNITQGKWFLILFFNVLLLLLSDRCFHVFFTR